MMAQYVSNKCLSITPAMDNATHRFSKHIFLAVVLASMACLATSAPLTSDSDGSQKQSSLSALASPSSSIVGAPSPITTQGLSHLVKRSAPAPYSGHSIMRFGRAAHSIMHFGKRSNEQLDENVANEPLLSNETPDGEDVDAAVTMSSWKQFPLLTDGYNRFVLVPVSGNHYNTKRALSKFQDETPGAVGRDNVFMHFG